jgi:uncharacterized damage-inducible protein DinB
VVQFREYARIMARYNRWMNERLYAVCAEMSDAERKLDRGAFFRSIHGTLNHLLLGDRIWLGRFRGQLFGVRSLDQELYADFGELRREREGTDGEISDWVESLGEEQLAAPFSFRSIVGARDHAYPLWTLVVHFFNHQTHHRGQLTTLLSQSGRDPGVTDLLWCPGLELSERR